MSAAMHGDENLTWRDQDIKTSELFDREIERIKKLLKEYKNELIIESAHSFSGSNEELYEQLKSELEENL